MKLVKHLTRAYHCFMSLFQQRSTRVTNVEAQSLREWLVVTPTPELSRDTCLYSISTAAAKFIVSYQFGWMMDRWWLSPDFEMTPHEGRCLWDPKQRGKFPRSCAITAWKQPPVMSRFAQSANALSHKKSSISYFVVQKGKKGHIKPNYCNIATRGEQQII